MTDDGDTPEPTDTNKAPGVATDTSASAAARSGKSSPDTGGVGTTSNQIDHANDDAARFIDSLHVPDDAGRYHDALVSILEHIPERWGRWISCDAGWYPLITQLHAELCTLDPKYVVHQVKEKFGALRFYAESHTSDDGVRDQFYAHIAAAEQHSARTCERCSAPGELCVSTRGQWHWYKTLCPACVEALNNGRDDGYAPVSTFGDSDDH